MSAEQKQPRRRRSSWPPPGWKANIVIEGKPMPPTERSERAFKMHKALLTLARLGGATLEGMQPC